MPVERVDAKFDLERFERDEVRCRYGSATNHPPILAERSWVKDTGNSG